MPPAVWVAHSLHTFTPPARQLASLAKPWNTRDRAKQAEILGVSLDMFLQPATWAMTLVETTKAITLEFLLVLFLRLPSRKSWMLELFWLSHGKVALGFRFKFGPLPDLDHLCHWAHHCSRHHRPSQTSMSACRAHVASPTCPYKQRSRVSQHGVLFGTLGTYRDDRRKAELRLNSALCPKISGS